MKPGRELDALVAQHVMKCKVSKILDYGVQGDYRYRCDCNGPSPIGNPPHAGYSFDNDILEYSSDIAAAWQVVEKLGLAVAPDDEGGWVSAPGSYYLDTAKAVNAPTATVAICLAALKVVGVNV